MGKQKSVNKKTALFSQCGFIAGNFYPAPFTSAPPNLL